MAMFFQESMFTAEFCRFALPNGCSISALQIMDQNEITNRKIFSKVCVLKLHGTFLNLLYAVSHTSSVSMKCT